MFGFIKSTLTKAYHAVTQKLSSLFGAKHIDAAWLDELKKILLAADTGPAITEKVMTYISDRARTESLSGEEIQASLISYLQEMLPPKASELSPTVLLIVGINGSGKTTFIGKLLHLFASKGERTLVVAGDTFRAAATEQLGAWAAQEKATLHVGKPQQDPSSVVFDGCTLFKESGYNHLVIDTAGRLQTKTHLMNELSKIKRTVTKQLPQATIHTWLVLDSMLGQNCISQAKQFHQATDLTGIVVTKCDGTGKAGFLLNISHELHLPIVYITFGEGPEALAPFDSNRFVTELLQDS